MDARTPEDLLHEMAWLRRVARRLVDDPDTADDLAGDTFVSWLSTRGPVRSARAWLATVLRHRAERHQRRERLRRAREHAARPGEPVPAVDEALAAVELHRTLAGAVLALSEPSRSAVVLRFLEDLPLAEVARRLAVPVETARTRIKRGLEQLRARLDQRYGTRAAWTVLLRPLPSLPTMPSMALLMATKTLLVAGALALAAVFALWLNREAPPVPPLTSAAASTAADVVAGEHAAPAVPAAVRQDAVPAAGESAKTAVIVGRVVDEAALVPLRDVEVTWAADDGAAGDAPPGTRTGVDGRFELATTAPLPLQGVVMLRHPDRALVTASLNGAEPAAAAPRYDLGDVTMPPGTVVRGTVFDHEGSRAPATDLFVCLHSFWTSEGRIVRLVEARAAGRSGADGGFRLDDRLLPNRPPPLLLAAGPLGIGWLDLADLRRDEAELQVEVQLHAMAGLPVRVVDARGQPIVGALVVGEPRFVPLRLPGTHEIRVETVPGLAAHFSRRTAADGRVELRMPLLSPGEPAPYTVRVEAAGRDTQVVPVSMPHDGELLVVLPQTQPLTVRGVVRDTAGRPLARAEVTAHWRTEAKVRALDDGSYSLALVRGDGPLWVEVAADGVFPARQQAQPAATESVIELDFTLRPAIALRGNVVDQVGRPVRDATVWTADELCTTTDAAGAFHLPVPPASARVLHVRPPEPSGRWRGGVEHLLLPGQSTVTLVLTRHPPGRSRLEVELSDAQGRPLEPRHIRLARADRRDGITHPATGTIGRVSAGDLTPGEWTLTVEPTSGCELAARFVVEADLDVNLRLQQPIAATVCGEVVFEFGEAPPPASIDLRCAATSQRGRFVPRSGQQLSQDGASLRMQPLSDPTFVVTDLDPARALELCIDGGDSRADLHVPAAGSAAAPLRIVVRAAARVAVRSPTPLLTDELTLQFRRPGGDWGEPIHCEGLAGRTELFEWRLAAGAWDWRLQLPTEGVDNRAGPTSCEGHFEVEPGGAAVLEVPRRP